MNTRTACISVGVALALVLFSTAAQGTDAPHVVGGMLSGNSAGGGNRSVDGVETLRDLAAYAVIGVVTVTAVGYGAIRFYRR
jgi:hypothetical protein